MLTDLPCIYAARCLITNKRYIGSALKGLSRSRSHIRSLRKGEHHNRYLQNAWNKHGEAGFVWELVEICAKGQLLQREQFWINHYKAADPRHGFNIAYPVRQRLPSKRMSISTRVPDLELNVRCRRKCVLNWVYSSLGGK